MKTSGAWLIPTLDGLPYLDKPAFYFRSVALSLSFFGESETSARLPSAVFGFTLLLMVYAFCKKEYGRRTAALAILVLSTTPLFLVLSRLVTLDMALTLAVCAAIFAGYVAEEKRGRERRLWYLAGAFAAAVATLIKGPVGFVLPSLVLLAFGFVERRLSSREQPPENGIVGRLLAPLNLALFLVIVLTWFVGVTQQRPDFLHYGLVEETFQRFTSPAFHRTAPFYYYVPVIAGVFFPWSTLLPESILAGWRARGRSLRADRLLVTTAVVIVLFFSLSQSKLPGYVLPALVALGILTARVFDLAWRQPHDQAGRMVLRGALLLAVASAVVAGLLAIDVFHLGDLSQLLHVRSAQFERSRVFFTPVLWTLAGTAVASVMALRLRNCRAVFAVYVLLPIVLLGAAWGKLGDYADAASSRPLARRIETTSPSAEVTFLECFATGLPFYLKRNVFLVSLDGHETTSNYIADSLQNNQDWPSTAIHPAQFPSWLARQEQPVYLFARAEQRAQLETLASGRGAVVQQIQPDWWGALLVPTGAH